MPERLVSVLNKPPVRYALAVAAVAAALYVRYILVHYLGMEMPLFITAYPAIILVAVLAGFRAGMLATVMALLGTYYLFLLPFQQFDFSIARTSEAIEQVIFAATSVLLVCLLDSRYRYFLLLELNHRVQQELYFETMQLSLDAVIILDAGGAVKSWNRGAEQLYGYNEIEVMGRDHHQTLRTIPALPWPEILHILRGCDAWERELHQTAKDGWMLTVSARYQLIAGPDGVERILKIGHDVTETKCAEKELVDYQERLAVALAAMPDTVVIADASGKFINAGQLP